MLFKFICALLRLDILRAHYSDGELCAPGPGQSADPKACAGNDGTTVTASTNLLFFIFLQMNLIFTSITRQKTYFITHLSDSLLYVARRRNTRASSMWLLNMQFITPESLLLVRRFVSQSIEESSVNMNRDQSMAPLALIYRHHLTLQLKKLYVFFMGKA